MAKQTPEGKVKKRLLQILQGFGEDCFYYMPVQNGMGQSGIPDVMAIIHGHAFAFECKATAKQQPTTLQAMALMRIHEALGTAWVVDIDNIDLVENINLVNWSALSNKEQAEKMLNYEDFASLYRWKHKLKPVEFA